MKPTPQEVVALRDAFPEGAPFIAYRTGAEVLSRAPLAEGATDDGRIAISISSEMPVLRYDWWTDEEYYEVLDHRESSVVMDYARDGMPFVASHRSYDADQQHGLIEDVRLEKKRLVGDMKPSRAPRSQEIAQDMRDGIRKKISVGYIVGDKYEQKEKAADGIPIRRYLAWMPFEGSTVPVPADYSVGVGRARAADGVAALTLFRSLFSISTSSPPGARGSMPPVDAGAPNGGAPEQKDVVDVVAIQARANEEAAQRAERILGIAALSGNPAIGTEWLRSGISEEDALKLARKMIDERDKAPPTTPRVELSNRDKRRFSFVRSMLLDSKLEEAFAKREMALPGMKRPDFGFERELRQEFSGADGKGFLSYGMLGPLSWEEHQDYRAQQMERMERAVLNTATASLGGAFVYTTPGDFIPMLRNNLSVMRAGATVLSGLTGTLSMPKQLSAVSPSWFAENPGSNISVTNMTTGNVTLNPKSVGVLTQYSRQLMFQAASGNVSLDQQVMNDFMKSIGLVLDAAALNGLGSSNQPAGLMANTSVGIRTLGANGGTIAWADVVALETAAAQANGATGRLAYLTTAQQRGKAKGVAVLGNTASGIPIWTGEPNPEFDGVVNQYRAFVSQNVPSNLTKGTATTVCSAWAFGAFQELFIGFFGPGIETIPDELTMAGQALVQVTGLAYMDTAVRYAESFQLIKDALNT